MSEAGIDSQVDFPFQWVQTKDGSMSLKSLQTDFEWMHSLAGAYAESQFIYGECLRCSLKSWPQSESVKIFSLGLGLGYVEFLCVLECIKANLKFELHSFESEMTLKQQFINELSQPKPYPYFACFQNDYTSEEWTQALNFFAKECGQDLKLDLVTKLNKNLIGSSFYLHGPLDQETFYKKDLKNFNIIFYDAYSKQSQSELWDLDFLLAFIKNMASSRWAVLSTYASTSSLKKALKKMDFQVFTRSGFAGKRESTLASKGFDCNL